MDGSVYHGLTRIVQLPPEGIHIAIRLHLAALIADGPRAYALSVISSGFLITALGVSLVIFSRGQMHGKDIVKQQAQVLIFLFAFASSGIVAAITALVLTSIIGAMYGGMLAAAIGTTITSSSSFVFQMSSSQASHRRVKRVGFAFIVVGLLIMSVQFVLLLIVPTLP